MLSVLRNKMPGTCCTSSPVGVSGSDNEVDGTDYLLSSTMRLDENFLRALGKCAFSWNGAVNYFQTIVISIKF